MNQLAKPRLFTLVVNERSGGGRAGRLLPKVARRLREQVPAAELHIISSSSWVDAENLTRAAALEARPGDALLVMGGDGMAHLGLNAAAGTRTTLGVIPAGTGNDFVRGLGLPRSIDEAISVVVAGRTRSVDLTRITNPAFPQRYVGAVVSTGYDARVNRATNEIRLRLGALSYGYIALKELAGFSPLDYQLTIDGELIQQEAMLVAVANTGMFGGGMRIAPEADPADGLLDVTVVGAVSRTTLLRLLPSMYSGGFVRHPAVEQLRARRVEIAGEGLFVMGDGEELGPVPVTAEVAPGVLKVFVP
ncbi:diacylglycerol kinase family lipid kinase [Arachnia propionica]|uniref:Diacylglycerol kinase family lipid kinase n=1 Tax=Arachnia propionica TaxID=1750 RepID=A0A3P1T5V2_9ACTN|nr:YegS/Rv2252/BmrU family lipid kinase [Arachnia propionica]RRD04877.1 diacylglycerol kinase family lipid kinase [Arachnia propionica]